MRPLRIASRGAELVGAAIFATMFGAFLLQIFMRYVVNQPLGWTLELCMVAYLWLVFWGCAFLLRERDHIAFNIAYHAAPPPVRRILAAVSAVVLAAAMIAALPATFDFVSFMGRTSTWVLHIRFDLLFSIFLVFMAAVAIRQLIHLRQLFGADWQKHL